MSEQLITIAPSDDRQGASFEPSPLSAQVNDVVCWKNTTNETHQPWLVSTSAVATPITRGSANYLSDPIPPGRSSRPSFVVVSPGPLNYFCATHPERPWERGQISAQQQVYTNTQPQTTPDE